MAFVTADESVNKNIQKMPKDYGQKEYEFGVLYKIETDNQGYASLPVYLRSYINHRNFLRWEIETKTKNTQIHPRKIGDTASSEELFFLEREFYKKYGGKFVFYEFRIEVFITEILILLFAGGFSFVIIRMIKSEKHHK